MPREPPAADLARYTARAVTTAVYPVRGRFRFHASAAEVADVVTPSAGLVEPIDEHNCQVTMGSANLDTMVAWLGVLGFDFDVLDPPELAAHLHALAARLIRAAGRGPRDEWSVYG